MAGTKPFPAPPMAPEQEKKVAMRAAQRAADKADKAIEERDVMIRFAHHEAGASLRELADVTGLSHTTIKRIAERGQSMAVALHRLVAAGDEGLVADEETSASQLILLEKHDRAERIDSSPPPRWRATASGRELDAQRHPER